MSRANFVIIGGGIAGVSCAEELGRTLPDASITLLSASDVLKGVRAELYRSYTFT